MDSQPITDSSGYGKNATFTGTPRTTRPIVAKGIGAQLLDSGDVISYPIDNIMVAGRESRSFTLEAWVKPTYGDTKIIARDNSGLFIDGLKLRFSIDMGTLYSVEYKNLRAGEIYHIVAIYDATGMYLFINGVKVAGADINTPSAIDDTAIKLSSSTSSSVVLDSVATYPYALPISVIVAHYTTGVSYPSVTDLSRNNGGNHYDFIDNNASVYAKAAFPDTLGWTAGISDGTLAVVNSELVNLYNEAEAQHEAGTWTYQETLEIDTLNSIVASRILWSSSDPITVEKSDDGGATWIPLTNGGQIVSFRALTSGYTVSIRVTIPSSVEQISVEYLSIAFYSSLNIKGSDEDLPATILNPAATTIAELHRPAASFNDNAGVVFADGTCGLSIPEDDVFGGYFAVEMTVRVDTGANNATILYVDTASAQPKVTTDSTGKWTFANLTALYVDGVSISSGTTITTGEWHHVIAVFSESLAGIYVGNNKTGSAGYPMRIGHLATYSDAVSPTDAQTIYKAWVGAPSVAITDGSLTTLYDGDTRPVSMALRTTGGESIVLDYGMSGWKYLQVPLGDTVDRSAPGFNDSSWATGTAPFGNGGAYSGFPPSQTNWSAGTGLWLRRKVTVTPGIKSATVTLRVDNSAKVYWNGSLINIPKTAFGTYTTIIRLKTGTFDIAIHALDDGGVDPGRTFVDINFSPGNLPSFRGYSGIWAIVSGG
jgi:hypothetical protein